MSNRITTWALAVAVGLVGARISTVWAEDSGSSTAAKPSSGGMRDRLDRARSSVGNTVQGAASKTESTANTVGQKAGNVAHKAGNQTSQSAQQAGAATGDAAVTSQVKAQLAAQEPDAAGVNVDTSNGVVTLSGTVDSPDLRQRAVELARNAKGVKDVQDHLTVETRRQ